AMRPVACPRATYRRRQPKQTVLYRTVRPSSGRSSRGTSGRVAQRQRHGHPEIGWIRKSPVHFHALLFDGVYTRTSPTARPVFHRLPPHTDTDIVVLLPRGRRRVRRLLIRPGRWADAEAGSDPFAAQATLFASAVAASLQGRWRWAHGPDSPC